MNINKAKFLLKKNFNLEISNENIENEYSAFKKKLMLKKLENDTEYTNLCNLLNHQNFHQLMTTRLDILNYVVNHRYLQYHPRYEEIIKQYKFLQLLQLRRESESMDEDEDEGSNI
jgi:hypothetical protein